MNVKLNNYQIEAIQNLSNGKILYGGVGSGKSRTALAYYYIFICKGGIKINGKGKEYPMFNPTNLYIITTPKKRDDLEWNKEAAAFGLGGNIFKQADLIIDSWNNVKKYVDVKDAFFIFDEQRVVGKGVWVDSFLKIAKNNQWILLSATPGDSWSDYIPVFIANGFYKSRTDFDNHHTIFARFSKYRKVERYVGVKKLEKYRDEITIPLGDNRKTIRHDILIPVDYDKSLYHRVFVDRFDPYEECPIQECGKLCYLLRKVVNDDTSRLEKVDEIYKKRRRCIIFYNFNYELERLKSYCEYHLIQYAEWNGHVHQPIPENGRWLYLVQYASGAEGWNCIDTDTMIFYSQNYSYRATEQSKGRIDRMNTLYKDLYYYTLRSTAPIDLAIAEALKNKKNFNERKWGEELYFEEVS